MTFRLQNQNCVCKVANFILASWCRSLAAFSNHLSASTRLRFLVLLQQTAYIIRMLPLYVWVALQQLILVFVIKVE